MALIAVQVGYLEAIDAMVGQLIRRLAQAEPPSASAAHRHRCLVQQRSHQAIWQHLPGLAPRQP